MKTESYEFRQWCPDGTDVNLTFDEDESLMNCYRFHDFCKRAAIAFGYMPETVEKVFGETDYEKAFNI